MIRLLARLWVLVAIAVSAAAWSPPAEAKGFGAYLVDVTPEEVFPGADRFGPRAGAPPAQAAFKADQLVGYVFETSDIGYSGKPIRILVGMNTAGVIVGAKVSEHHEPILLAGIPPEKLTAFVAAFVGRNVIESARQKGEQQVDA